MEFSKESANLVIDAYTNNNLEKLGLVFEVEPNKLKLEQRRKLMGLGIKVLDTAILSKYQLKSYGNLNHYKFVNKIYKTSEMLIILKKMHQIYLA